MHDIKSIRQNADFFKSQLRRRCLSETQLEIYVSHVLTLDQEHRSFLTKLQEFQSKRHQIAKEFAERKRQNFSTDDLTTQSEQLKVDIPLLEKQIHDLASELNALLSDIPNLPALDTPDGKSEEENIEILRIGTPPSFDFIAKSHDELGKELGLIDFERSAKLSGARFVVLYGLMARLERALAQFMLDTHVREFGYVEVYPPLLVKEEIMFGTGQLPKFKGDQFQTTNGMWLIPTAEVVLTNLVNAEVLNEDSLPLRFTAYTPCFRLEAGAAGRDTHGMIRQHQFSKVELVSITTPEASETEHERMLEAAKTILNKLELPYRVLSLCTGDIGFSAQKTYDIEVWLPSQNTYREISSCSKCGEFQARRMNTRFRSKEDQKLYHVHTLNGSGLAVGRTIVAILENYQNEDGSIQIPQALVPYMGGITRIGKDGAS